MCFERTKKGIRRFNVGYKVMRKKKGQYLPAYMFLCPPEFPRKMCSIKIGEWVDEMPYRRTHLLLNMNTIANVGWHIFTTLEQAREWKWAEQVIVRVECYGAAKPYGYGLMQSKPAGRFQFMKILEEIK